ncbi:DUF4892 domain-containing protein [Pseudomonas sp. gcc21]|uniref:DUF4892 domain-containing protein n=1 Tax=Pseudomonas sp. gcc21 TaxID=2726989 RepID=UPI001451B136|nr:DUF4892 domain-containing protein [Pseudomonas sp. gcc21]QJD58071.1 DUF4892 domain-containing protein [Pseudomonas sp. gcc21]
MPSRRRPALLLMGLAFTVLSAFLQAADAIPDELMIQPFPRAEVARVNVEENIDHGVAIGSVRRINNKLRAEREVRTVGSLLQVSWLIPSGHDADEAFAHATQQLLDNDTTMLYFCEGRECGSSSTWASQVIGFSRLYGPDDNQAYLAMRVDEKPQRFLSLYVITRGNRQVYLHVDQFTPDQPVERALYPTPATLLKVINSEGHFNVPAAELEDPEGETMASWLDLLNRALRTDTRLRVVIHGAQAPAVVQGLADRGIRKQRLEVGEATPGAGIRIVKI